MDATYSEDSPTAAPAETSVRPRQPDEQRSHPARSERRPDGEHRQQQHHLAERVHAHQSRSPDEDPGEQAGARRRVPHDGRPQRRAPHDHRLGRRTPGEPGGRRCPLARATRRPRRTPDPHPGCRPRRHHARAAAASVAASSPAPSVSIASGSEYVARAVWSTGNRTPVSAADATPAHGPTTRVTSSPRASSANPIATAGSTKAPVLRRPPPEAVHHRRPDDELRLHRRVRARSRPRRRPGSPGSPPRGRGHPARPPPPGRPARPERACVARLTAAWRLLAASRRGSTCSECVATAQTVKAASTAASTTAGATGIRTSGMPRTHHPSTPAAPIATGQATYGVHHPTADSTAPAALTRTTQRPAPTARPGSSRDLTTSMATVVSAHAAEPVSGDDLAVRRRRRARPLPQPAAALLAGCRVARSRPLLGSGR